MTFYGLSLEPDICMIKSYDTLRWRNILGNFYNLVWLGPHFYQIIIVESAKNIGNWNNMAPLKLHSWLQWHIKVNRPNNLFQKKI